MTSVVVTEDAELIVARALADALARADADESSPPLIGFDVNESPFLRFDDLGLAAAEGLAYFGTFTDGRPLFCPVGEDGEPIRLAPPVRERPPDVRLPAAGPSRAALVDWIYRALDALSPRNPTFRQKTLAPYLRRTEGRPLGAFTFDELTEVVTAVEVLLTAHQTTFEPAP